jgi:hypothetical protein
MLQPFRVGNHVTIPGGDITTTHAEDEKEEGQLGVPNWPIFLGNVWWSWTESNRRPLECHASSTLKLLDFGSPANDCQRNILASANRFVAFSGAPANV